MNRQRGSGGGIRRTTYAVDVDVEEIIRIFGDGSRGIVLLSYSQKVLSNVSEYTTIGYLQATVVAVNRVLSRSDLVILGLCKH